MSYNIDTWKTKELKDLKIPLSLFSELGNEDYRPKVTKNDDGKTVVDFRNDEIIGVETNGILLVEKIHLFGVASGYLYHEYLLPILEKSTGVLTAVTIGEHGDSISRLECVNGKVTETNIEL